MLFRDPQAFRSLCCVDSLDSVSNYYYIIDAIISMSLAKYVCSDPLCRNGPLLNFYTNFYHLVPYNFMIKKLSCIQFDTLFGKEVSDKNIKDALNLV